MNLKRHGALMARGDRWVLTNSDGLVIGEDHHRAKLTDHEVELIHQLREGGMSLTLIAQKFEVAKSTVCCIVNGTRRGQLAMGQRKVRPSK